VAETSFKVTGAVEPLPGPQAAFAALEIFRPGPSWLWEHLVQVASYLHVSKDHGALY
jgi:hypothetical protein